MKETLIKEYNRITDEHRLVAELTRYGDTFEVDDVLLALEDINQLAHILELLAVSIASEDPGPYTLWEDDDEVELISFISKGSDV